MKTGTVVTKIDGKDARRYLEERAQKAWASGGFFSSPQRARLFEFRIPLRGKEGEKHTITCFSMGKMREIVLTSNLQARGWPHIYNLPAGLKRVGRSFFYTRLPSGAGYMYLRRVDNSVEPGISQALSRCPGARGWIIDLCGNGGGGYGASLIQKIRAIPRPIVVIIDAGCMSAGETLARDIARLTGARILGSKTAGCSSAKRTRDFPSGIASIVIPQRSRWRSDGKPIEFNGIDPHLTVEAVPAEVARGLNSAICRAEQHLRRR